jgi:hypothetical protein
VLIVRRSNDGPAGSGRRSERALLGGTSSMDSAPSGAVTDAPRRIQPLPS